MIVNIGGRRSGKTQKTITWWLEDPENRIILCHNEQAAVRVRHIAFERATAKGVSYEMNVYNLGIIGATRAGRNWGLLRQEKLIAIDDLDFLLAQLFGHDVEAATMTAEEWK